MLWQGKVGATKQLNTLSTAAKIIPSRSPSLAELETGTENFSYWVSADAESRNMIKVTVHCSLLYLLLQLHFNREPYFA